jgi:hypothetical protein
LPFHKGRKIMVSTRIDIFSYMPTLRKITKITVKIT